MCNEEAYHSPEQETYELLCPIVLFGQPTARPRHDPTDDWNQLRLLVTSPEQEAYEVLRPIVLFGQPLADRARETGVPERTLRRKAARFETQGMRSLFAVDAPLADDR